MAIRIPARIKPRWPGPTTGALHGYSNPIHKSLQAIAVADREPCPVPPLPGGAAVGLPQRGHKGSKGKEEQVLLKLSKHKEWVPSPCLGLLYFSDERLREVENGEKRLLRVHLQKHGKDSTLIYTPWPNMIIYLKL